MSQDPDFITTDSEPVVQRRDWIE